MTIFLANEATPGEFMNQFVIDLPSSSSGLRSGFPASGDKRASALVRAGSIRSAWPFLVNANREADKQSLKQDAGNPSGFAS
ncbi:hypothetical protein [Polaromonas sp.]|uniref:hypothetical protein n=1 Tax=Polaromonas sp. TaxID=1869339 RepID=UPI003752E365